MTRSLIPTAAMRGIAAAWLGALTLLAACGGGGDAGTATTAGAAGKSYTQGAITGFGSVIVNGVRFDDTGVTASDDDGAGHDLKLGMQVEIQSGTVDDNGGQRTAKASSIRVGSEMVGPAVNVAPDASGSKTGTFKVLSQTVLADSATVFDANLAGGLTALAAATAPVVEVHALFDSANNRYRATRIELKTTAVTAYKLRGTVASLNTTAKTFSIGAAVIAYGSATEVPPTLADGQRVRVRLATTQNTDGSWSALTVRSGERKVEDRSEAHLRGLVSDFTDAKHFSVDGVAVDASNASFPDGTTGLAKGTYVEVEGTMSNGVVMATKVELEDHHTTDADRQTELHGTISNVNTTAQTFVLRGVTVRWTATTVFQGGLSAATLATTTAKVEVKATLDTDGVTQVASLIKLDN